MWQSILEVEMTLSDDELSKLIELASKSPEIAFDKSLLGVASDRFYTAANPTTVKAMAEELLAARGLFNAASVYINGEGEYIAIRGQHLKQYLEARKKNEGEK
jgi:hypothetical protein